MSFFEKDKRALHPIDLFEIEHDIPYFEKRPKSFDEYRLEDVSDFYYESKFADVGLFYNKEGIGGYFQVDEPFSDAVYPDFQKGDALELFICTRDLKSKTTSSPFCHHFVIFPTQVTNFTSKELTHFRQDDARALSDPCPIWIQSDFRKKEYITEFFIPKSALYGFEEMEKSIRFTYVIHAPKKGAQYFSVSYENFNIPQMPALWAQGNLLKK
jgi:hypothetical protein